MTVSSDFSSGKMARVTVIATVFAFFCFADVGLHACAVYNHNLGTLLVVYLYM